VLAAVGPDIEDLVARPDDLGIEQASELFVEKMDSPLGEALQGAHGAILDSNYVADNIEPRPSAVALLGAGAIMNSPANLLADGREREMSVAKVIEISSSSDKSFEDAVMVGISRADATLDEVQGAWIKEQKVKITKGKIVEYRVNMLVTFLLKGGKKK
jgi:hypothetical protein